MKQYLTALALLGAERRARLDQMHLARKARASEHAQRVRRERSASGTKLDIMGCGPTRAGLASSRGRRCGPRRGRAARSRPAGGGGPRGGRHRSS